MTSLSATCSRCTNSIFRNGSSTELLFGSPSATWLRLLLREAYLVVTLYCREYCIEPVTKYACGQLPLKQLRTSLVDSSEDALNRNFGFTKCSGVTALENQMLKKGNKRQINATNRDPMIITMRNLSSILLVVLNLSIRSFAQKSGRCQRDENVIGYSSLADINDDMQTELTRISGGGEPSESYTFRLCPNTVFDASQTPLTPLLSNAAFVCGADGNRNNNCIVIGGSEQVRIVDSRVPNYVLEKITFLGLTFAEFRGNDAATGTCVSAVANFQTSAVFLDVSFTVCEKPNCLVFQQALNNTSYHFLRFFL